MNSNVQLLSLAIEWASKSGISIVFAIALLWWVLTQQTVAMERLSVNQAELGRMVERLSIRVDLVCAPQNSNIR